MKTNIQSIRYCLIITFILGWSTSILAQGQNNTISLANHYWRQDGVVDALPTDGSNQGQFQDYDGSSANYTHSSIQDAEGNLLMFTVDGNIFDHEGYKIEYVGNNFKGFSESLIVPDPFNCKRFYIFSSGQSTQGYSYSSDWIPRYTVVNLDKNSAHHTGRKGNLDYDWMTGPGFDGHSVNLTEQGVTPNFWIGGAEGKKLRSLNYAATNPTCKNDAFVYFTTTWGLFQYRINDQGLSYEQKIMFQSPSFNYPIIRAEMEVIELSNGNHRTASIYRMDNLSGNTRIGVYFVDFDSDGNIVPSSEELVEIATPSIESFPFINGVEFSNDGSKLYLTHNMTTSHPHPIGYIDYANLTAGMQNLVVPDGNDFKYSQIETDENGNLIFVTSNRIAALTNPDNPNAGNWNNNYESFFNFSYSTNDFNFFKLHYLIQIHYLYQKS